MGFDDDFEGEERFGRRRDRRGPRAGRRRSELRSAGEGFLEEGLEALRRKGLLLDLGQPIGGGKEATVYRAAGPEGPLAAKVYSDVERRAFGGDDRYLEGRYVPDRRARKMLGDARRRGLSPELAGWVYHEYRMLWELHGAGLSVPKPVVGPAAAEIIEAGRVVLMEWIGADEPAPRLSDVDLPEEAARSAWEQARSLFLDLARLGLVHGDLSTFNLLWWQERVVAIDLPQMVELGRNRHAAELQGRDARSLCASFRQLGIEAEPEELMTEARRLRRSPPSPSS